MGRHPKTFTKADEVASKTSLDRFVRFQIPLLTTTDRASDVEGGGWLLARSVVATDFSGSRRVVPPWPSPGKHKDGGGIVAEQRDHIGLRAIAEAEVPPELFPE
jgi:hypothetical protein